MAHRGSQEPWGLGWRAALAGPGFSSNPAAQGMSLFSLPVIKVLVGASFQSGSAGGKLDVGTHFSGRGRSALRKHFELRRTPGTAVTPWHPHRQVFESSPPGPSICMQTPHLYEKVETQRQWGAEEP